jgi:DnaJ-class molecular chaperone
MPAAAASVTSLPPDEVLRQAETTAMQQLRGLERLATKEERQKAFKDLLRAWHPDKNPQNVEVATAVFQRLNAERKKVLS